VFQSKLAGPSPSLDVLASNLERSDQILLLKPEASSHSAGGGKSQSGRWRKRKMKTFRADRPRRVPVRCRAAIIDLNCRSPGGGPGCQANRKGSRGRLRSCRTRAGSEENPPRSGKAIGPHRVSFQGGAGRLPAAGGGSSRMNPTVSVSIVAAGWCRWLMESSRR